MCPSVYNSTGHITKMWIFRDLLLIEFKMSHETELHLFRSDSLDTDCVHFVFYVSFGMWGGKIFGLLSDKLQANSFETEPHSIRTAQHFVKL